MTDRELMQMARTALELRCTDADGNEVDLVAQAIKALRDRLAQPESEPAFYVIQATDRFGEGYEQTYWEDPLGFPVYTRPVHAIDISVDETAKDRHESVEYLTPVSWYGDQPLYAKPTCTAPPKREWIGLTDEEISEIEDEYIVDYRIPAGCSWNFAKHIEAKLKEKNYGY